MLGPVMNAGIDAAPIQKMCGDGSVPGPDFWENLTSLVCNARPLVPLAGLWCPWQTCGALARPMVLLTGLWCP